MKIIALNSGKGGVGKTVCAINLAVALSRSGKRVLLLNGSPSIDDVGTLLGVAGRAEASDVLQGKVDLKDVIAEGASGVSILPGRLAGNDDVRLEPEARAALKAMLDQVSREYDFAIVDTVTGLTDEGVFFNSFADESILLSTADLASVRGAYLVMKALAARCRVKNFKLIVNMASLKQSMETYRMLSLLAERYLKAGLSFLGCLPCDKKIQKSVLEGFTVTEKYPEATISLCFNEIAREIISSAARTKKQDMEGLTASSVM